MSNNFRRKITDLPVCNDVNELDTLIGLGVDGNTYRVDKTIIPSSGGGSNHEYIVYNNYGCYAIYNETLKTIYIGETIVSFHQRWYSHYTDKKYSKKRKAFLNHPDTICTIIAISEGDKEETEWMEAETIKFYKEEYPDWTILGGTYRDNCWWSKKDLGRD